MVELCGVSSSDASEELRNAHCHRIKQGIDLDRDKRMLIHA
jgi:hypothetical protein